VSEIIVNGKSKLRGSVKIGGSKNAALPLIAATVICDGECVIENCPMISDCYVSTEILKDLGIKCTFENNTLCVNASTISSFRVNENLMTQMRSSSLFLGAILARLNRAEISCPGGCELGPRPIDLHIKGLKQLGCSVTEKEKSILFVAENGLKGANIVLPFKSVGATENLMLAASTAKGTTKIINAAREPEIEQLAQFLNLCGGKIYGGGTDEIVIEGVSKLYPATISVIPDRIICSTYISCVASAKGDILLENVNFKHIESVIDCFSKIGCSFEKENNNIRVVCKDRLRPIGNLKSVAYPGFPTDAGPMLVSCLAKAQGISTYKETIFENRFRYINELKKFGAKIDVAHKLITVRGVKSFKGARCECTDLRGGAALIVAALGARGTSVISKTCYIKRGYEDIVSDLKMLGGDIKEV